MIHWLQSLTPFELQALIIAGNCVGAVLGVLAMAWWLHRKGWLK